MFLTTHAAAGILISRYVHNPSAVFGISFASHFVLDFIPHGDEHLYHDEEWKFLKKYKRPVIINTIDLAALVGLTIWGIQSFAPADRSLVLIGILGSILPDFLSHLFPVIHQRFNWLFFVRWVYSLTKPTGLRYLVRSQDWIHRVLHHEIIRRDIPFAVGFVMQAVLFCVFIGFAVH